MIFQPEEILKIVGTTYALWLVYFYCSTVKVKHVGDGDGFTIMVRDGLFKTKKQQCRMAYIDAPECQNFNIPEQPHGPKAKQSLKNKIEGKRLFLKRIANPKTGKNLDHNERWIVVVSNIFGSVNAHQVFWGHAWNYEEYGGRYYFHEWFARGGWCFGWIRQGLWKGKNPIPPWEWRKKKQGQVVHMPVKKARKKR